MVSTRPIHLHVYMNAKDKDGLRSVGPAVLALQIFLLGYRSGHRTAGSVLEATGVYDDATIFEVSLVQRHLGFKGDDVDGNCGPGTRSRIKDKFNVDLERIFAQMQGPGRYAQPDGTMLELEAWPEPG